MKKHTYGPGRYCKHGKHKPYCRECGGSATCEHKTNRYHCKECGGSAICEHGFYRRACKRCGAHSRLIRSGFTSEEVKEMGNHIRCQFPRCGIQVDGKRLNSDHVHTEKQITPENYRGEICTGCNYRLKSLDSHPEWANEEEREYMARHPYSRKDKQNGA